MQPISVIGISYKTYLICPHTNIYFLLHPAQGKNWNQKLETPNAPTGVETGNGLPGPQQLAARPVTGNAKRTNGSCNEKRHF